MLRIEIVNLLKVALREGGLLEDADPVRQSAAPSVGRFSQKE